MAVGEYIGNGNPDGTSLGYSATELVSFHGATPCDQAATVAAVATTAATSTEPHGWGSTQANAIVSAVNSILTALKEKGLMASA